MSVTSFKACYSQTLPRPQIPPSPAYELLSPATIPQNTREGSTFSDISELSVLSRSPSPPADWYRETAQQTAVSTVSSNSTGARIRGPGGRFTSLKTKRSPSPEKFIPEKRAKMPSKPIFPNLGKLATLFFPTTDIVRPKTPEPTPQTTLGLLTPPSTPGFATDISTCNSLGAFSKVPQEIRQKIFAITLNIEAPVTVKPCCGPDYTDRRCAMCRKHGLLRDDNGRFSVLYLCKQISMEAQWVLYNQGNLHLSIDYTTDPYITDYHGKTARRLGDIPVAQKTKMMWMAAAKFRFVNINIPTARLGLGNPMMYLCRLKDTIALLLKAWEEEASRPTAVVPHTVKVNLSSLFNEVMPFNADPTPDPSGFHIFWLMDNYPDLDVNYKKMSSECFAQLKTMVVMINHHHKNTKWTFTALSELDEDKKEGITRLVAFMSMCEVKRIDFEGLAKEKLEGH